MPKEPRRIMREFTINEISAVDNPAQAGAKALIMKRHTDVVAAIIKRYIDPVEGAVSFDTLIAEQVKEDRYHIIMQEIGSSIYTLESALRSIAGDANMDSEAKQAMMRSSVEAFLAVIRERWPDVEEALQESLEGETTKQKGNSSMDAETKKMVDDLNKQVTDLTAQLEAATAAGDDAKKAAELQGQLDELTTKSDALAAQLEEAATKAAEQAAVLEEATEKAKMSDDEKAHFASLSKEDKGKFLAMSSDDRKKAMKKSADDDETIEVDGVVVSKAAVGDSQFAIIKSQQARIEQANADIRKERDARELAQYTKRADDELGDLPGETAAKAAVLKAVDGLSDEVQATITAMFKAGSGAIKSAFDSLGHGGGDNTAKDAGAFEKKVAEIRKRDDVSRTQAMATARKEHPDLFKAYQGQ